MINKPTVLFLCTGNSCRSQMAEGLARQMHGDRYEVASAGTELHGMNSRAVAVMGEAGVDISNHYSKTVDQLDVQAWDYVITVCNNARDNCPYMPANSANLHHAFPDPPALSRELSNEEEILTVYRQVRDSIAQWITELPAHLSGPAVKA